MLVDAYKYMKTYECKKDIANYLIYKMHLPVLDVKGNIYYFLYDENLKNILGSMPLWLKLYDKFTPR